MGKKEKGVKRNYTRREEISKNYNSLIAERERRGGATDNAREQI